VEREEMITILEEIIRDEGTNPTARCTAIRTLPTAALAATECPASLTSSGSEQLGSGSGVA
jgi:hypothetical protein